MLRTLLVSSLIFWIGLRAQDASNNVVSIKCGQNKLSPKQTAYQFYSFNSEISTGEIMFTGNVTDSSQVYVNIIRGVGSPSESFRNQSLHTKFWINSRTELFEYKDDRQWSLLRDTALPCPLIQNKINSVKIKMFPDHFDVIVNGKLLESVKRLNQIGEKLKAATIWNGFAPTSIYLNCTNVSTYGENDD